MKMRSGFSGRRSLWLCVAALLAVVSPLQGDFDQLRSNANNEVWGNRQSNTSQGKLLWFEHDDGTNKDDVYLFNGMSATLVQAQGDLTGVADTVFALGTGSSPGQVIAVWRRDTDFAWISVDGNTPVLVIAINPSDPAEPLNPEGAAIADGCVFLILQDASGAFPRKYVYRADPATGNATILTDPAVFPVTGEDEGAPRITTSGCKAAWRYFDGSGTTKLHFYNGSGTPVVIDSGDIDLPHMSRGRVVYAKTVGGVSQVFLYDSNLPSPAPVPITSYVDPTKTNSHAKTDGRHVAWLRQDSDNVNRHIVLNGGLQFTNAVTKPADGGIFIDFPLQLQRGQLLWKGATGNLLFAFDRTIQEIDISPAMTAVNAWLADGYVVFTGLSSDGGTDTEPFRADLGFPPADTVQPSPPILVLATPGDGRVTVTWDQILGATSYNLYYATAAGVTKDNYASLPGGTRVTGVSSPHTVTGLANGTAYYFVVTAVESATEGPESSETPATPKAAACVKTGGGEGCASAIASALAAASAGDTIRVAAGTYAGNLVIDKTVTLEGGWNASFTTRNPAAFLTTITPSDNTVSVVGIQGPAAPVLDGFTIMGGRADLGFNHGGGVRIRDSNAVLRNNIITGNASYLLGGGVWVQRGAPRLENNRIEANRSDPGAPFPAQSSGGGVTLEDSRATLIGNVIRNNVLTLAGYGGGVDIRGGGPVWMDGNWIQGNHTSQTANSGTGFGGGVSVLNALVTLTRNTFQNNLAHPTGSGSGGGLFIRNDSIAGQSFNLTDNLFLDNAAANDDTLSSGGYHGGGASILSSNGTLTGNTFRRNQANLQPLGDGGGLYVDQSELTIQGGEFSNNSPGATCGDGGGGLTLSGSVVTIDASRIRNNCGTGLASGGSLLLSNAIVTGNPGYGLYAGSADVVVQNSTFDANGIGIASSESDVVVQNTIFKGHETYGVSHSAPDTSASFTATYNDFFDNTTNASGVSLDSTNLLLDPQLDSAYRPAFGSPVVDAGTDTGCPAADFFGRSRPIDGDLDGTPTCDIGAAELGFETRTISPSSGPAGGGTATTIGGALFESGAGVTIGGVAATGVSVPGAAQVLATSPALQPGTLNDVVVTNPDSSSATLVKGWLADFLDVADANNFHDFVEKLFRNKVTAGCGGGNYCISSPVTRAQMSVFILKGKHGSSYTPPPAAGTVFSDVAAAAFAAAWIEQFSYEGITAGCGGGKYCPNDPVTRAQMAVFLLKAKHGRDYLPPPATGVFGDVPVSSTFAPWIEQLAEEGITAGCGGGNYCPGLPAVRGQMAVFIVKTFGLP